MNRTTQIQILLDARNASSVLKRRQAAARYLSTGRCRLSISFAGVAREAGVSTWLVYNVPEIRQALSTAMTRQAERGYQRTNPETAGSAVSSASLRTDLALARHELKQTRAERDTLRRRVERALGDEIREP